NEVFTRGDEDVSEDYSQAIRYEVNEKDKTVKQTWSYGKDRGESFFSHIIGNVQYLYDQDNLILNSGATEDANSPTGRSEEHTSELQSRFDLVCRLLLQ